MKTNVTARHFELTDKVKDHATEAMLELEKYFERIVDARTVLSREKDRWSAELIVGVPGETLTAASNDALLFTAIDDAAAKAGRQLKKYKAKIAGERERRELQQMHTNGLRRSRRR